MIVITDYSPFAENLNSFLQPADNTTQTITLYEPFKHVNIGRHVLRLTGRSLKCQKAYIVVYYFLKNT